MTAQTPATFGASKNPDPDNSWSAALPSDGAFEVAGMGGWMARRAMQMNPEIEPNVRSTVRGLVGSGFSDRELETLQKRALEAVEIDDLVGLRGIQAGVPSR